MRRWSPVALVAVFTSTLFSACGVAEDEGGPCWDMQVGIVPNGMAQAKALIRFDGLEVLGTVVDSSGLTPIGLTVTGVMADHGPEWEAPPLGGSMVLRIRSAIVECDDRPLPDEGIAVLALSGIYGTGGAVDWHIVYILEEEPNSLRFAAGYPPSYRDNWDCELDALVRQWHPSLFPQTVDDYLVTLRDLVDVMATNDDKALTITNASC